MLRDRTAASIAMKCGIISSINEEEIMTGERFRAMVLGADDEIIMDEFDKTWPNLRVLARSSPIDKLTLVSGQCGRALPFRILSVRESKVARSVLFETAADLARRLCLSVRFETAANLARPDQLSSSTKRPVLQVHH